MKILGTLIALLLWSVPVQAAVLTVCPSGCDYSSIQSAVTASSAGDRILVNAGHTYTEEVTFPQRASTVELVSASTLPNRRITSADTSLLPTISSGTNQAAFIFTSSSNWTIDGFQFLRNTNGEGENIQINGSDRISMKRLLVDLTDPDQQKRFVLGNGTNISLTQSYCSGIWKSGQDTQCFIAFNGAGPYTITDNYLEAASENVMFGGADPSSEADIPANITVENNYFTKREAWRNESRNVKNIFELKCAHDVVVRGNVFEKNWTDGQTGTAIVFTPVNQLTDAPWCGIQNVLFERNIIRDTEKGLSITGYGYQYEVGPPTQGGPTKQTTQITVSNNLWQTTTSYWAAIGNEVGQLTMEHNTYICDCESGIQMLEIGVEGSVWPQGEESPRDPEFAINNFTFRNNFVQGNEYGVRSSNGFGNTVLSTRVNTLTWANNVLGMAEAFGGYPETTTVITKAQLHAELNANNSYLLNNNSTYKGDGTDGADLGWNGLPASSGPRGGKFKVRVR